MVSFVMIAIADASAGIESLSKWLADFFNNWVDLA
jgi:hypothetical protein